MIWCQQLITMHYQQPSTMDIINSIFNNNTIGYYFSEGAKQLKLKKKNSNKNNYKNVCFF